MRTRFLRQAVVFAALLILAIGTIGALARGRVLKWTVVAAASLLVMRLFFVQQLIAAFLIFSVSFAGLAVIVLILFALDLAWQNALGRAEAFVMVLRRSVRRGEAHVNNPMAVELLTPVMAHRIPAHKQTTFFR